MDMQVVGSVYGAVLYVTHYTGKDESQVRKNRQLLNSWPFFKRMQQ